MTDAACPLCGGSVRPEAALAPHPFVRCERCAFVFRPDAGGVAAVYEEGEYAGDKAELYEGQSDDRRRDARSRLGWFGGYTKAGGTLLDVGAAGGEFVFEAGAAGFAARGVEPTPSFAAHARERVGVDVVAGTLESLDLEPGSLDVVTMWHVLEHIPDPLAQIRRIAEALRPGGVLAIEVPNYGSAVAARMGAAWPSLEPEVHVNQFAPDTLRALLERGGLEIAELGTTTITPLQPLAERLHPRSIAYRAKAAVWLRDPRTRHPTGHELLRAVAKRPGAA